MNINNPDFKEQLLAYRKKHFAVEVTPTKYPDEVGQITLSTTTNGNQWQSISLLRSEVKKVIKALRDSQK